jgi:hypothetical protein
MNHPLAQLGYAQLGDSHFSDDTQFINADQSDEGGDDDYEDPTADFSNQEIVNDLGGINGENDEAFAGFGAGGSYAGSNLGDVDFFKRIASNSKAKAAIQAKKISTAIHVAGVHALAASRVPLSAIPQSSQTMDWSSDERAAPRDMSTIPWESNGEVVSNGAYLTVKDVSPKPVLKAVRSKLAHPFLIYAKAKPMAGFEGFFDDIKRAVSTSVNTSVKSTGDTLLTNLSNAVTGNKAIQKAVINTGTQAALKQQAQSLVEAANNALAYAAANKAKLAIAIALAGGLTAYLLFFRRRRA